MSDWRDSRNILTIRPDNIGDVIMLGPALRAIKETSPDARITLLASPAGSTAAPLLPWVDDVLTWRPVWQDAGGQLPLDPGRERDLVQTIAGRGFDAAMIFTSFSQTPHVPGYMCYLAGIPLRAGESKEFGGSTLTHELPPSPDTLHQVERNLKLVETLGFPARDRRLAVSIADEEYLTATRVLDQRGIGTSLPYVLVHPGASAAARRYPPDRFAEVVRLLAARGWPVVVTGTMKDEPVIDQIRGKAPDAVYVTGETPLGTLAALVGRASLVICGNTLPIHLADALGTPMVVLFSGTEYEEQWRPRCAPAVLLRRPTDCHPCYLFDCPIGQPCLDIAPVEVVDSALAMLARTAVHASLEERSDAI